MDNLRRIDSLELLPHTSKSLNIDPDREDLLLNLGVTNVQSPFLKKPALFLDNSESRWRCEILSDLRELAGGTLYELHIRNSVDFENWLPSTIKIWPEFETEQLTREFTQQYLNSIHKLNFGDSCHVCFFPVTQKFRVLIPEFNWETIIRLQKNLSEDWMESFSALPDCGCTWKNFWDLQVTCQQDKVS